MGAAGRVGTDQHRVGPCAYLGQHLIETVMWSAAVLAPALPGRSIIATGSPVPSGP